MLMTITLSWHWEQWTVGTHFRIKDPEKLWREDWSRYACAHCVFMSTDFAVILYKSAVYLRKNPSVIVTSCGRCDPTRQSLRTPHSFSVSKQNLDYNVEHVNFIIRILLTRFHSHTHTHTPPPKWPTKFLHCSDFVSYARTLRSINKYQHYDYYDTSKNVNYYDVNWLHILDSGALFVRHTGIS